MNATTRHCATLAVMLDRLYRWRWRTSAVLATAFLVAARISDGARQPVTWAVFCICAVFLWLPILLRWILKIRAAGRAFRDGLDER